MPEGSSNSMGSGGCVGILGRGSSGISRGTAGSPSDSTSAVDTPSLRASLSARVSPFASSPSPLEAGGGGEGGVRGLGGIFFGIFGRMKLRSVMVKSFNSNDLVVSLLVSGLEIFLIIPLEQPTRSICELGDQSKHVIEPGTVVYPSGRNEFGQ